MNTRLLLLAAWSIIHASCDVFTNVQTSTLESFIDDLMECRQVPGLTLAVVSGDDTWTRGFGYADIDAGRKVTPQTLFGIGSLTKAFTSALLAILLEESNGRFNWTSTVSAILGPDFAFADDARTKELTLRDLLTHRTGLHPAMISFFAGYNQSFTRAEFAKRFRFLPEVKPMRDEFEYNNLMYTLVGHIVEVLSGDSWEDTLEKRLFKPLGMDKSRILGKTVNTNAPTIAKPYAIVENVLTLTESSLYE